MPDCDDVQVGSRMALGQDALARLVVEDAEESADLLHLISAIGGRISAQTGEQSGLLSTASGRRLLRTAAVTCKPILSDGNEQSGLDSAGMELEQ